MAAVGWRALVAMLGLFPALAPALVSGPWSDRSLPPDQRARLLLKEMTLDEKLGMMHGPKTGPSAQCKDSPLCAYVGNVAPVPRLQIPPITMNDGPQGFRDLLHPGTSTAFPAGITVAATWDVDAAYAWGAGQGREFKDKGSNVQLGPGMNVARVPVNGRNFEYVSGEDPYLGYTMVQPIIRGIQSQKVVANAKHYVLNNQETNRLSVSSVADERTRFEVYYPPFEGAIQAGVGSFMCGYNKINGAWSCENPRTLGELKGALGFTGYVMSDWGATHSTSIMQGLDMEMPSASAMNEDLVKLGLSTGQVTQAAVDDTVLRILRPMFAVGVMDEPVSAWDWKKMERNVTTEDSIATARHVSAMGTVLLKNDGGVLPLPQGKKLAVIGLAGDNFVFHGMGSGEVAASCTTSPLEGIRAAAGTGAQVLFADGSNVSAAVDLARSADYALVFLGTVSGEGRDRASLDLDHGCNQKEGGQCGLPSQNALVEAVANASKKVVAVVSVPGAVLLPWSGQVAAILTNFYPGQEAGHSISDILFGKVNPSGKLPVTFPNKENELDFSSAAYPGVNDGNQNQYAFYTERLLVGYRTYDAKGIGFTTGFPFGHGLSYTTFGYTWVGIKPSSTDVAVSFIVTNRGGVAGAEVAQLYLSFPAAAGEPLWQLKGFQKTKVLAPGEQQNVTLTLTPRDRSIWDVDSHSWSLVNGGFEVAVGSSSRDVRLHSTFSTAGSAAPLATAPAPAAQAAKGAHGVSSDSELVV